MPSSKLHMLVSSYTGQFYYLTNHVLAHRCSFPGCGSVLVLDGNMKNYRDVCHAKDAGYVKFEGLDGSIKTGCPESPGFKSRYCVDHKNQACDLLSSDQMEVDDELNVVPGAVMRSASSQREKGSLVAELILSKKVTRKMTYYQVTATLCDEETVTKC